MGVPNRSRTIPTKLRSGLEIRVVLEEGRLKLRLSSVLPPLPKNVHHHDWQSAAILKGKMEQIIITRDNDVPNRWNWIFTNIFGDKNEV
jgi:hypothetical protein